MERMDFRLECSRDVLKYIALVSMLLDHIAFCFFSEDQSYHLLYIGMRILGRIAFPLFCFLLVRGFFNTKNLRIYFFRIILFAFLSEIPFDLFVYHQIFTMRGQNVLFTLSIALLVLYGISKVQFSRGLIFLFILCGSLLAVLMRTDYTYLGVLLPAIMYLWREERFDQFVILCVVMGVQGGLGYWEVLALPFIFSYHSAHEGKKESKQNAGKMFWVKRYFFYWFYPVHMLCLFFCSFLTDF